MFKLGYLISMVRSNAAATMLPTVMIYCAFYCAVVVCRVHAVIRVYVL